MSKRLDLFITGYERPDLLRHQVRLIEQNLRDPYGLCLVDNSRDPVAKRMEWTCGELGTIGYIRCHTPGHRHEDVLNLAARHAQHIGCDYFGFLDHDIFPIRPTEILPLLKKSGFYGLGQRDPTGHLYLWPGFCFFSREWLAGRALDFGGTKGPTRDKDGDAGAALWPLFTGCDWDDLPPLDHGYRQIRPDDGYGSQSSSVEILGDWLHLSNASKWKKVPNPRQRDLLEQALLAGY